MPWMRFLHFSMHSTPLVNDSNVLIYLCNFFVFMITLWAFLYPLPSFLFSRSFKFRSHFFQLRFFSAMSTTPQSSSNSKLSTIRETRNVSHVQCLSPDSHRQEGILWKAVQSMDLSSSYCSLNKTHCLPLTESYRRYKYRYLRSMMTVYYSTAKNLQSLTDFSTVPNFNRNKTRKMIILR